jgi:metallopeptidase MepB
MICSFPPPTPKKPTLLRHFTVVQLFHELGHAIHDLVSVTRYARFHGPSATPVDYGEFPSQMLENWCWIPAHLKEMSKHYSHLSPAHLEAWKAKNTGHLQPPEKLPDELIESAVRPGQPRHGPLYYLRQLALCIFDMTVHQPKSHDDIVQMDISRLWDHMQRSVCFFDDPAVIGCAERNNGCATFQHLVNDYDAGYYSYLL